MFCVYIAVEDASSRQPGYAQDGELWLTKVWDTIAELEKDLADRKGEHDGVLLQSVDS